MKLESLWGDYKEYTSSLSEQARVLAFGAAGICWFFRSKQTTFPGAIMVALLFVVAFFMTDLLQYYSAAVFLGLWTRSKEKERWAKKQTIDGDYDKPAWLDWPAYFCFHLKIILLGFAFVSIGIELLSRAWHNT
jgi:hypothetical protein